MDPVLGFLLIILAIAIVIAGPIALICAIVLSRRMRELETQFRQWRVAVKIPSAPKAVPAGSPADERPEAPVEIETIEEEPVRPAEPPPQPENNVRPSIACAPALPGPPSEMPFCQNWEDAPLKRAVQIFQLLSVAPPSILTPAKMVQLSGIPAPR